MLNLQKTEGIALKYNFNTSATSKRNCIKQTCNYEWMLTLRIKHTHLRHSINNFGIYIADRHWCISHVTICGTPYIAPNYSHQAYCSKKALHEPDTTSFIIRTAVLTRGFLPHASRRLLTRLKPFLFSVKL